MAQENTEQDKSEEPSFFKLKKAREEGSVARGMDLGFFTGLAALLGWFWLMGPSLTDRMVEASKRALVTAPTVLGSSNELLALTGMVLSQVVRPLAFMGVTIFAIVLAFELVQTGVVFTTKPLKIDFNRLNPAANLKKLFTFRILIETGKNILKMAVYLAITWLVIRDAQTVVAASVTDASSLTRAMVSTGFRLVLFYVLAAAFFAAIDQGIVRRDFLKKMRMSRRELKREVRDREGEPRMKQRRKQLHSEFVKLSQSLKGVRGADVVITNPTHYAVGLRYEAGRMEAPMVVARGADHVALRLRKLAFIYGVTVIEDRELARALYHQSDINRQIPQICFRRVADHYLAMRKQVAQSVMHPAHA